MKKLIPIILISLALLLPQYVHAASISEACFPAVQCDTGEHYYNNDCRPQLNTISDCGAAQAGKYRAFNCDNGCHDRTKKATPECPGGVKIGRVCYTLLDVIDHNKIFKIWDGTALSRLVYMTDSACNKGQVPTWSGSQWKCGSGGGGDDDDSGLWSKNGNNIYNKNSGNVGIGDSNPTLPLTVEGNNGPNGMALFKDKANHANVLINAPSGKDTNIVFKEGTDNLWSLGSAGTGSGGSNERFRLRAKKWGKEVLSIFQNGKVGIGTVAPNAALTVVGNANIGLFNNPSGAQAIATGFGTTASGLRSFATGITSEAKGHDSIAAGASVKSYGNQSVAMGSGSQAYGLQSVAIGMNNITGCTVGSNCLAAQATNGSNNDGAWAVALGNTNTATGRAAVAMGGRNKVLGYNGFSVGLDNIATDDMSVAMGWLSESRAETAIAMGYKTYADKYSAVAIGHEARATARHATALGYKTSATGLGSFSAGSEAYTKGTGSTAIGFQTSTSSDYATAIGYKNTAGYPAATAIGSNIQFNGNYGVGIGLGSAAKYVYSPGNLVVMGGKVGIGTSSPSKLLDVAGAANLNNGKSGGALYVNGKQALWSNGTFFSWGYDGNLNQFADPIAIGSATSNGYNLRVHGTAAGNAAWTNLSDQRLKKNVQTIDGALDKVKKLRGVEFEWKDEKDHQKGKQIGFIAQEVNKVIPEVVTQGSDDYYSMSAGQLTAVLTEAVKELNAEVKRLKKRVEELENK